MGAPLKQYNYRKENWEALYDHSGFVFRDKIEGDESSQYIGIYIFVQRLLGNTKKFQKGLALLKASINKPEAWDGGNTVDVLLSTDSFDDGIDVLIFHDIYGTAIRILCFMRRFDKALEILNKSKKDNPYAQYIANIYKASVYYHMGLEDKAAKHLNDIFSKLDHESPAWKSRSVIALGAKLGFYEQAKQHFLQAAEWYSIQRKNVQKNPQKLDVEKLEIALEEWEEHGLLCDLFDYDSMAISGWKILCWELPKESKDSKIDRLDQIIRGKYPIQKLEALVLKILSTNENETEEGLPYYYLDDLADICLKYKQKHLAVSCLKKFMGRSKPSYYSDVDTKIKIGKIYLEMEKWSEANGSFADALSESPLSSAALFLKGWSLQKMGKTEEGQKLMLAAKLISMTKYQTDFLTYVKGSEHQKIYDQLMNYKTLLATYFEIGYAVDSYIYPKAIERGDYQLGAIVYEHQRFDTMSPSSGLLDDAGYVLISHRVHSARALQYAVEGKISLVRKHLKLARWVKAETFWPTGKVMEILTKKGMKKEADAILKKYLIHAEKLSSETPFYAYLHNQIAWEMAIRKINIDKAMQHAKKAVELKPNKCTYIDTLAECWFQKGQSEKSVEIIKKAIQLAPMNEYYKKQLKRFETGSPSFPEKN